MKENWQFIQSNCISFICRATLWFERIRFSLFECKFPKPEVPPRIQKVRSSEIRWIERKKRKKCL